MGPLIKPDPDTATPLNKLLAKILQFLAPKFALGKLDEDAITRDKSVVKRVKADKLNWHGGYRARHTHVLLQSMDNLQNGILLRQIRVPILTFQGGQDRLVDPNGAKFLHQSVSSNDKKLVMVEEAFHNLYVEFEAVKVPVIKETIGWILKHI